MRLHLPKALLAAVLAACLAWPAGASTLTSETTTIGGVKYSGYVIEYVGTDSQEFHKGTFATTTAATDPTETETTGKTLTITNASESTNTQFDAYSDGSVSTEGKQDLWKLFCSSSDFTHGHTLKLNSSASKNLTLTCTFKPITIGGLISTGSASSYTLASSGDRKIELWSGNSASGVNMAIGVNTTLNSNAEAIEVKTGGSWVISKGKSLTLSSTSTNGVTIASGQNVNVSASGDGTGNASLTFSGAVTNNGTLNIGSNVLFSTSNTITNTGSITFSSGATINLDSFQPTATTLEGSDTTGVKTWSGSWTLATGGTVTAENGVNYQYKGKLATSGSISGGVISANGKYFNIISGDEKSYAEATADSSINFINVLGTLTGISGSTTSYAIRGDGLVQVSGELQYHVGTFLDNFTGTLEIGSGGFLKLGDKQDRLGNLAAIKVTEGGQIGGWGTAKPSGVTVELAGGKLTSDGGDLTYSGRVKVTADSTIEPETGTSLTISGFVDAQAGVITTNGSVKHTDQWDMSGTANNYTSSLKIASGTFESAGSLWGTANSTKILLEEGANFKKGNFTFTGKADVDSSITFGKSNVVFSVGDAHTADNTTVTFAGGNSVETIGMNMSTSDLVASSGRLNVKTSVNAKSVTVKNGATIEMLSDILSAVTSTSWTWETGSTLSYGNATNYNYDADLGIDVGQKTVTDSGTTYGTTIELHGFKGGLASTTAEIARDIKLTNNGRAAAEFTDIKGTSYTFTGKVKGDGNLVFNQPNHETALSFKGDLSEWTSDGDDQYGGLRVCAGTINATIEGTPKKGSVANAFNADGGTLNLTISRDATLGNRVVVTSLTISEGKSLNLANNGRKVAAGSTVIGAGATVTVDNKSTAENGTVSYGSVNLGTLTGSGTLKITGGTTEVTNASGFSGTLAATGGNIELQTAADLTLNEVVVSGGSSISGATSYTADKVSIGEEGGRLVGSLSINTNGTITLDASAGTTGTGLSLSTLTTTFADEGSTSTTGSLTLGSKLTLNLLNINLKQNQSLTLFSGVTSAVYGDAATELTADGIEAKNVFTNLTAGDFKLSFDETNHIVALVAQRDVPEPTTATLSLLALMGLAARRRRRKA